MKNDVKILPLRWTCIDSVVDEDQVMARAGETLILLPHLIMSQQEFDANQDAQDRICTI